MRRSFLVLSLLALLLVQTVSLPGADAESFGVYAFQRIWSRADRPVVDGKVRRALVWGSEPFTGLMLEPYADGFANGTPGSRRVQYFDKGRMEVTDSRGDPGATGYVSEGLLARELITGKVQLGDKSFRDDGPAQMNVAGDAGDDLGPTYAALSPLMANKPIPLGWSITQVVDGAGHLTGDQTLAAYGVTAQTLVAQTNHTVASVFWSYLTSSGTVYEGGRFTDGALFNNAFFATGYPLTEPYWTQVTLGGKPTRVLIQVFERRVLTYTPANGDGFKVESNNVGRDYYQWRYGPTGGQPTVLAGGGVSFHRDPDGNLMALGTLTNRGKAAEEAVQVSITLYDAANQPLSTASTYLDLSVVAPGESVPFRVWFDGRPAYDHFRVSATGATSLALGRGALVGADEVARKLPGGGIMVTGMARNVSNAAVVDPLAVVVLYDDAHQVVDYLAVPLGASRLLAGDVASYQAVFALPNEPYSSYAVFFSE